MIVEARDFNSQESIEDQICEEIFLNQPTVSVLRDQQLFADEIIKEGEPSTTIGNCQQKDVLVATDAGAPGISDPGYRLIRAALQSNVEIKVLPGPSAVTTALLLSGLPTDRFCFEGFPPRTQGARAKWFEELAQQERTMIFFEAPHRITECLIDAGNAFGLDRSGAICREMSKHYEEVVRGSVTELISWSKSKEILGEITVVIAGFDPASRQIADEDLIKMVLELEEFGESRKEAIAQVAKKYAVAKRVVFDAMVTYKSEDKI